MDEIAVPAMSPPMISRIAATTNTDLRVRSGLPRRMSIDDAALRRPGAVPVAAKAEPSAGDRHAMKESLMCGWVHICRLRRNLRANVAGGSRFAETATPTRDRQRDTAEETRRRRHGGEVRPWC